MTANSPEQPEREAAIERARGSVFGSALIISPRCDLCEQKMAICTRGSEYLCVGHYEDQIISAARAAGRAELEGALQALLNRWDEVLPYIMEADSLAHIHGWRYRGPEGGMAQVIEATRALLSSDGAERAELTGSGAEPCTHSRAAHVRVSDVEEGRGSLLM